jgi:hypothetical protein
LIAYGESRQLSFPPIIGRKVLGVCLVARFAGFFKVNLLECRCRLGKSDVLWPAEHLLCWGEAGRAGNISPFIEKSLGIFSGLCGFG